MKLTEQDSVEAMLNDITENVDEYGPEISDQITGCQRQRDSLLYTMDCASSRSPTTKMRRT